MNTSPRSGALLLVALVISSCGGGKAPEDIEWGLQADWYTAYLPYVEEVSFPAEVYEGEQWVATLSVSSAARPACLRGRYHTGGSTIGHTGDWSIELWLGEGEAEEPVIHQREIAMPGLPAGDWPIRVLSTPTRELGGAIAEQFDAGGRYGYFWDVEGPVYRDYTVHVLPPRSASP